MNHSNTANASRRHHRPWASGKAYLLALRRYAGDWRLIQITALVVISAALEGTGLLLLVPLLGLISGNPTGYMQLLTRWGLTPDLPTLLALFVLLVALRVSVIRLRDMQLLKLRLGFVDALRLELQVALASAQWRYLSRLHHADILHVLTSDINRVSQGTYFLMQGLASLSMGFAGITVAYTLSPTLTLVALLAALVLALGMQGQLGRAVELGQHLSEANRNFFTATSNFLGGLKLIKANGAETEHIAEFERCTTTLSHRLISFAQGQSNTRATFEIGAAVLLSLLVYGAIALLGMPFSELLPLVLVFSRLLPMAKDWHNQLQQLLHMLPAFDNARRWLRRCQRAAEQPPNSISGEKIILNSDLMLTDISFRYHHYGSYTLSKVCIHIPARQMTALVGLSGAGKTTLADIALGLLSPDSGTLAVDGQALTGNMQAVWRRSVAYVPQDAFLFPTTIRENLLWPHGDQSDDNLWAVLEKVAAADFIRALPQQMDTMVGERGIQLSGGERQRIVLARALLTQPQLLVLDEATSHLDNENEQRIQQTIKTLQGSTTLLTIAHRLSTIHHADQIIVLHHGHVVQTGSWDDLANQPGLFSQLIKAT